MVEKKTPDTFFHGGFRPGHIYTHRPDLDLDFRKNVTKSREAQKKRNLAGRLRGDTARNTKTAKTERRAEGGHSTKHYTFSAKRDLSPLSVATESPNELQHSHIGSRDLPNNQASFW